MYNIYAIVIFILFDIPLFSVNFQYQFQVADAPRFPIVMYQIYGKYIRRLAALCGRFRGYVRK